MSKPESESTNQLVVEGARRLVADMLKKVIADYQILEKRGYVSAGVVSRDILPIRHDSKRRRIVCGFMTVYDVFDLMDLLWSDELRVMCEMTQLNITPKTVRALLKLPDEQPVFEGLEEIRNARQGNKVSR